MLLPLCNEVNKYMKQLYYTAQNLLINEYSLKEEREREKNISAFEKKSVFRFLFSTNQILFLPTQPNTILICRTHKE